VKLGGATRVVDLPGHRELGMPARAFALPFHCRLETGVVDPDAALARDVRGEVDRKAEGVVELEHRLSVEHLVFAVERTFQHLHAVRERLGEAFFLLFQHLRHPLACLLELRIGHAHRTREIFDQPVKERIGLAQLVAVADRAPDNASQHVAAPLVAGNHAIDDEKRTGADVIRDHLERIAREVLRMRLARGGLDQVLEQVDLVVRVHALQHRGNALEPHAGVDRRPGQRIEHAFVVAVELHEHEIPDLDVAVAVGIRRSRRPAGDARAVIVEDLAARPARPGVGHLPEVVALVLGRARLVADAHAARRRHADFLRPDVVGLVVLVVDRGPQALLRQSVNLRQQLPRIADRLALEVIAEAEVAQHLEEGVVARGIADVFEIVVLATGAHAALGSRGADVRPPFLAEEDVLELHHAGIREQQRRVVARHERARGDDGVAPAGEVIQKFPAYLAALHQVPTPVCRAGATAAASFPRSSTPATGRR
jgi:hypothetical protein